MSPKKATVRIRRVYEAPEAEDGTRVLVDRVWPRGLSKEDAALDEWSKDVAPSTELRRWYGHDPEKFDEFRRRYRDELRDPGHRQAVERLREIAQKGSVTLLTATKTLELAQAPILAEVLRDSAKGSP
ncbi:MAG: DUF488 domain-containing protein [Streptomycetaceae bacterium]|nr:DUF488 domain-containing protein [Streptomycetaceae bacterium]